MKTESRWAGFFLPSSLLLSCLLVYQPAVLMGFNKSAYYHRFFQLLPVLALFTLLLASLATFLCVKMLKTPRLEQAGLMALNFLALAVWLSPAWSGLAGNAPFLGSSFGSALYLLVLSVLVSCKNARLITQLLLFGLLLVFTHSLYLAYNSYSKGYAFNEQNDTIATFSSNNNVIYILLDAFDSVNFQKTLDSDPDLRKELDGFLSFTNAATGSKFTWDSIPSIQAGRYKFTEDSSTVYSQVLAHDDSFLTTLARHGFHTANYTWAVHFRYSSTANFPTKLVAGNPYVTELGQVLTLALSRALPGKLKNFFAQLNANIYFAVKRHEPLAYITNRLAFTEARPVAKFLHLSPLHEPFTFDEFGRPLPNRGIQQFDDLNLAATKQEMRTLAAFLAALKTAGVYDRTMIVVSGDHGYPHTDLMRRVDPALLIKDYSSHGELRISDAPVSLIDVAPTILARNHLASEGQGLDLLASRHIPPRVMPFFWFNEIDRAYDVFYILGDFHDQNNWIPQRAVVDGFDLLGSFDDFYVKLVNFGDVETVNDVPGPYRWGLGPESAITFYDKKQSWLKLDLTFDSPLYPEQKVDVLVNGTLMCSPAGGDSLLVPTLPGLNRITFRFAKYNHDGIGKAINDSRNFAVRFQTLKAKHVDYAALPQ